MTRKKHTSEENARREKIRELLQMANIGSMDDIQSLFKGTIAEFMENGLDANWTTNWATASTTISLQAETIVHSDQGFHYTSLKFIQILRDSNLRQSMSRLGNCWDNAPQESFFGHMKDEIEPLRL